MITPFSWFRRLLLNPPLSFHESAAGVAQSVRRVPCVVAAVEDEVAADLVTVSSQTDLGPVIRHVVNVRRRGVGEELPARGGGANGILGFLLVGGKPELLSGRHLLVFVAITPVLDHGLPGVHRSVDDAMRPLFVELPRQVLNPVVAAGLDELGLRRADVVHVVLVLIELALGVGVWESNKASM